MKLTPIASSRTSACPLPGCGVSTSASFSSSGPPVEETRMAFMRARFYSPPDEVDHDRDIDDEQRDADWRQTLDELVDLERDERNRRNDRQVLRPDTPHQQSGTFDDEQRRVRERADCQLF